jgi:hypothetical protein
VEQPDLTFVIPTYRLRDVGDTVEQYDQHFWRNGHSLRIMPPFFPTRLRFEDYIYRLWVQQNGVLAAHVDAAQHHTRSGYMRNPPAAEIFNEDRISSNERSKPVSRGSTS